MVREADTEAEETAKKEKLEVSLTVIVNWGHQDADDQSQGLQNNYGANQSLLQEKVQEWMSSLGSKLEEKSPQAEEKVLIHLSSSLTLLSLVPWSPSTLLSRYH